jgi:hypothetical protein
VHAQSPTDLLSVRPGRTWSYSSTMTLHNGNGESAGGGNFFFGVNFRRYGSGKRLDLSFRRFIDRKELFSEILVLAKNGLLSLQLFSSMWPWP